MAPGRKWRGSFAGPHPTTRSARPRGGGAIRSAERRASRKPARLRGNARRDRAPPGSVLPNVGKSTLFNALTKAGIQAENYPSAPSSPTSASRGARPRLAAAGRDRPPQKIQPAIVEFVDIAGLVAARPRAKAWATSSSPTSARPTPSSTSCAASPTTTSSTSRAASTRSATSRSSTPSSPRRHGHRREGAQPLQAPCRAGDKEAKILVAVLEKCFAQLDQGKPGARARPVKKPKKGPSSPSA